MGFVDGWKSDMMCMKENDLTANMLILPYFSTDFYFVGCCELMKIC